MAATDISKINQTTGNSYGGHVVLSIKTGRVKQIGNNIKSISDQIKKYEEEVQSILRGLQDSGIPLAAAKGISIYDYVSHIDSLHGKCNRYGERIQEIVRIYEKYESEIAGYI